MHSPHLRKGDVLGLKVVLGLSPLRDGGAVEDHHVEVGVQELRHEGKEGRREPAARPSARCAQRYTSRADHARTAGSAR